MQYIRLDITRFRRCSFISPHSGFGVLKASFCSIVASSSNHCLRFESIFKTTPPPPASQLLAFSSSFIAGYRKAKPNVDISHLDSRTDRTAQPHYLHLQETPARKFTFQTANSQPCGEHSRPSIDLSLRYCQI